MRPRLLHVVSGFVIGTCLSLPFAAQACTWFGFLNDEDNAFIGRTMEWPGDLHAELALVPRAHSFGEYSTKHGFVGMYHRGVFSDGMNEHGLAMSVLWLSESEYQPESSDTIAVTDILPRVLGGFRTVDEALTFIQGHEFHTFSSEVTSGLEFTVHLSISDTSGRSVVVEFASRGIQVYENEVGVMTNDPTYDKHLEIWSAYDPSKFSEETFEGFDYSPEGRFCRMAAFNATQAEVPTDADAVNRAWSMVNSVDIPQGILYWRWVNDRPQFTSYSVVADLANRVYYLRTYENYDVRKVDLRELDFGAVEFQTQSIFGSTKYRDFSFE